MQHSNNRYTPKDCQNLIRAAHVIKGILEDICAISDPQRRIYQAFGLKRGTAQQLLGLRSMLHAIFGGALFKHGIGAIKGDPYQMPGSFVLKDGRITSKHLPQYASEEASFSATDMCGF